MPRNNLYLCGFMASGKSTVGKLLAETLGWPFVDTDELIENAAGTSIRELFERRGEPYFRKLESRILSQVAQGDKQVIACGGGIILAASNLALMRATGLAIGLLVRPETVLQRVEGDSERPLLNVEARAKRIEQLLAQRQPLYEALDLTLNTDALSPPQVVERLLLALAERNIGPYAAKHDRTS